ncbi:MAG: HNH endonuclease [Bryobacteraceae bacterium]
MLRRKVANPEIPQRPLHIVQGGVLNGDKSRLESRKVHWWMVPKTAAKGDELVIYIRGLGFFATARVTSAPRPRTDWKNRYRAGVDSVRLISPPVSLGAIRRHVPDSGWAKYPRSITTPPPELADGIRTLIAWRRTGGIDLDEDFVDTANIDELKMIALHVARERVPPKAGTALYRAGSAAIRRYVLGRAKGLCEGCGVPAPFRGVDGQPFLEAHHTTRLADDGPDHPRKVIGICPNCHRRAHLAEDAKSFNTALMKKLRILEAAL